MFILAESGRCYARLQFSAGPGASLLIPVEVDFSRPFGGSDELTWEAEYLSRRYCFSLLSRYSSSAVEVAYVTTRCGIPQVNTRVVVGATGSNHFAVWRVPYQTNRTTMS